MSTLRFITLTGAGEATSFDALRSLSERFDLVEWGVLYSPDRAGEDPRYPRLEWLENFAAFAQANVMSIALHLCGRAVEDLLEETSRLNRPANPTAQRLLQLAGKFGRVQVNTRADVNRLTRYERLVAALHRSEARSKVIFQLNSHNAAVCHRLAHANGIEFLVDASGGRGISPEGWPALEREVYRRAGYAGGLGPDNIVEQVTTVATLSGRHMFWLDMEGKLRGEDDTFDLARCESVLTQVCEKFLVPERKAAMARWGEGTRNVHHLKGMWLDWWVARATGRAERLVAPPPEACRAVYMWRQNGSYEVFSPSENEAVALRVLGEERIALVPSSDGEGQWDAWPVDRPDCRTSASDMTTAGLRALVLKRFGPTVPANAYWGDGIDSSEGSLQREEVAPASAATPQPVWVVIQEGGSSVEAYAHAFETRDDALAYRLDCLDGAYRTSEPVAVPASLANTPGFLDAVQSIVMAAADFDYPRDEAQTPAVAAPRG